MAANNSYQEAVALIAAANRVVQDPNSVGAALRTISLRLRGTSTKELEEAGEDTTGVVESKSKLRTKIQGYTGIDILTDSGAYKSTYEILLEISKVWDDLTDQDRAGLLELIAGKTRSNTAAAILSNTKDLEEAYKSAMEAEGSAYAENEKYLDSIQGRIDLFNNSVQTMWNNALDSDVVKGFVNFGTEIIKIIDKIGLLQSVLIALATYSMIKNKMGPIAFLGGISDLIRNIVGKVGGFIGSLAGMTAATSAYTAETLAASVANGTLTASEAAGIASKNGLALATTNLTAAEASEILMKAGVAKADALAMVAKLGLTDSTQALSLADIQATVSSGTLTSAQGAQIASALGLTAANTGLTASLMALWTALWPILAVMAGVAVIYGVVKAIDAVNTTLEEQVDILQETRKEYEESKKTLEDINSELATTKDRIEELEGLGTLTITEQDELRRLKQYNNELEKRLMLADKVNAQEKKELAEEAMETFDKLPDHGHLYDYMYNETKNNANFGGTSVFTYDYNRSYNDAVKEEYGGQEALYDVYSDLLQQMVDAVGDEDAILKLMGYNPSQMDDDQREYALSSYDETEHLKAIDSLTQVLDTISLDVFDWISDPDTGYQTLLDDMTPQYDVVMGKNPLLWTEDDKELVAAYEEIEGRIQEIWSKFDPAGWFEISKNEIWADDQFDDMYAPLLDLAKDGQLDENELRKNFDNNIVNALIKACEDKGILLGDLLNDIVSDSEREMEAEDDSSVTDSLSKVTLLEDAYNSLGDAIQEFKEEGTATSGTLKDLNEIFGDTEGFEDLYKVLATGEGDVEKSIANVANAYIGQKELLTDLTDDERQIMIARLKALGVINAEEVLQSKQVAQEKLNTAYEQYGIDLSNYATAEEAKLMIAQQFGLDVNTIEGDTIAELENKYGIDLSNYASVAEAKIKIAQEVAKETAELNKTNSLDALNNKYRGENGKITDHRAYREEKQSIEDEYNKTISDIDTASSKIANIQSIVHDYYSTPFQFDFSGGKVGIGRDFDEDITKDGKTALETLQEKYERKIKNLENQQTQIENQIEWLEAQEMGVNADYYEKQIALENEKINLYKDELEALKKLERTDEVADAIWEVELAIQESTISLVEFRKAIAELYATASDKMTDAYDDLGQVYDDRKSFIENEISIRETKGELTPTAVYDDLIEQEKQARMNAEEELNAQADLYWQGVGDYNKKLEATDPLKKFGEGGNVDLLNRPQIDASKLTEAGWEDAGEGVATVFTNTFSNEDATVAMNFTPILPDGSVLSPDELTSYAEGVIAGTRQDDLGLQIGSAFNGEDAIQQASNAAEEIHQLQEDYYQEGQLDPNSQEAIDILEKIRQKKLEMQESDKAIAEYAEQQKDAYIAYYDAMMEAYSHRDDFYQMQSDYAQSYIDRLGTLNINVPDEAYEKIAEIQELSIAGLREQLEFANSELAKFEEQGIDKNDPRYIEKFKETLELEKEIYDAETEVYETHQQIFDNQIDRFNQVIDRIDNATQRMQNISGLLEREDVATEDGEWTAEGLTRLGMAYQQMEYYKQSADEVAKKIAEVEKQYKNGEISEKKYYETMEELSNQQWDAINSYEDMKDTIVDLNEARIDMIEEGLNKEIEAYQELIDLKKEELDAERALYDFKEDIEDQATNIASLQRRIASMSGSTDAATIAERTKLQAELRNAEKDLDKSYRDHAYDSISDALSDEMESYSKSSEDYLEKLRESTKDTNRLVEQTFADVMKNGQIVLETLTTLSNTYGIQLDGYLTAPWENATSESLDFQIYATQYFNAVYTAVETKTSTLTGYTKAPWEAGESQASTFSTNAQKYMGNVVTYAEENYKEQLTNTLNYPWEQADGYDSWGKNVTTMLQNKIKETEEAAKKIKETIDVTTSNYEGKSTDNGNNSNNLGGNNYKTGEDVKALQKILNMFFNANLKVDGSYGPATTAAVKAMKNILYKDAGYGTGNIPARTATNGEYDWETKSMLQNYLNKRNVGSWFRANNLSIPAHMYAKGTLGTKKNEWAITDESWIGEEITLAAGKNGQLQYLKKGSAVLPADISANLVEWGKLNPNMMSMGDMSGGIQMMSNYVNKPEIKLDIENFLNVGTVSQDTLPELEKLMDKKIDTFAKQLNASIRKFK